MSKYCTECGQELPVPKATHIVAVLDMSGSMTPQWDEVLSAYNSFIKEQQKLDEEAYVSLIMFDTVLEHPYSHIPLGKVEPLTKEVYKPRGMTALFDAVDFGIKEHNTKASRKKEKTLYVIITDGEENASRNVRNRADIKAKIEKARGEGCEFVFLAADEATFAQGVSMGIPQGNAFNYAHVGYKGGTQVMSRGLTDYRTSTVCNTSNFFASSATDESEDEEDTKAP